ncbi:MAG: cytochrome b/b6 domain-containing protein [Elusimicrobia bacterium]|nr:cytochrome b/b6 domain-containing protein [Elusimicrobiota bacterium]
MSRVYLFKRYERFWHWAQAALVLTLVASGFEVHGTWRLFGFERAVHVHEASGLGLLLLTLFTMFWHATTGEVVHFVPTRKNFAEQVRFYTSGIFRRAPHPEIPTPEKKFNPIQRAAYFSLLILVFPVQLLAGVVYLGTPLWPGLIDALGGLRGVALLHTAGAFAMLSFLIVHLYMITTGDTLWGNLKSMVTGYAEH